MARASLVPLLFLSDQARPEQPLKELRVTQKLHAVTPASLVPASEPEEGHDFRSAIAALGKLVPFSGVCLHSHCYGALFFSLDRLLHVRVSFTNPRPSAPSCHHPLASPPHAPPSLSSAPQRRRPI